MEDRWSIKTIPPLVGNKKNSKKSKEFFLVTVADGHGGHAVADFAVEALPDALSRNQKASSLFVSDNYAKTMFQVYQEVDKDACRRMNPTTGSTLCTVAFSVDDDRLVAANCGDTMAVVGNARGARSLSQEHKASSEVRAIEARGGRVIAPDGMPRVNGTLNLSRAIGDAYLKKYITSSPFVTRCRLGDFDYLIVATDGVWDVLTTDDVHKIVSRALWSPADAFSTQDERLADALREIYFRSRQLRSGDNIAIVGCIFSPADASSVKRRSKKIL